MEHLTKRDSAAPTAQDKTPFLAGKSAQARSSCFPPVVNAETRLLILGSLPGNLSLAAKQYYAHPRNQFWRLLGHALDLPLENRPYDERLHRLLKAHIGLWDVVRSAMRVGSLDSQMREIQHNHLPALLEQLPQLKAVAFNGQTAAKAASQLPATLNRYTLPSSSPALTWSFKHKLSIWRVMLESINLHH